VIRPLRDEVLSAWRRYLAQGEEIFAMA